MGLPKGFTDRCEDKLERFSVATNDPGIEEVYTYDPLEDCWYFIVELEGKFISNTGKVIKWYHFSHKRAIEEWKDYIDYEYFRRLNAETEYFKELRENNSLSADKADGLDETL